MTCMFTRGKTLSQNCWWMYQTWSEWSKIA